jgi:hypothetical protein
VVWVPDPSQKVRIDVMEYRQKAQDVMKAELTAGVKKVPMMPIKAKSMRLVVK